MTLSTPDVDIVILGQGPKGISLHSHLVQRGLAVVGVEAGELVGTWNSSIAGTSPTRTGAWFSDTIVPGDAPDIPPLVAYAATHPLVSEPDVENDTVPKEVVQDYYRDVATSLGLKIYRTSAEQAIRDKDQFRVLLATGEWISARMLVDATGIVWSKSWPRWASSVPADRLFHSIGHGVIQSAAAVGDRHVVVVGGGHATPDIATRMFECGARVTVIIKRPRLQTSLLPYPEHVLGARFQRRYQMLTPVARFEALGAIRREGPWVTERSYAEFLTALRRSAGRMTVMPSTEVMTAHEGSRAPVELELCSGGRLDADVIICATGFDPGSGTTPFQLSIGHPVPTIGGFPLLSDDYELANCRGYFVLGYRSQLGPRGPVDSILHDTQATVRRIGDAATSKTQRGRERRSS